MTSHSTTYQWIFPKYFILHSGESNFKALTISPNYIYPWARSKFTWKTRWLILLFNLTFIFIQSFSPRAHNFSTTFELKRMMEKQESVRGWWEVNIKVARWLMPNGRQQNIWYWCVSCRKLCHIWSGGQLPLVGPQQRAGRMLKRIPAGDQQVSHRVTWPRNATNMNHA